MKNTIEFLPPTPWNGEMHPQSIQFSLTNLVLQKFG